MAASGSPSVALLPDFTDRTELGKLLCRYAYRLYKLSECSLHGLPSPLAAAGCFYVAGAEAAYSRLYKYVEEERSDFLARYGSVSGGAELLRLLACFVATLSDADAYAGYMRREWLDWGDIFHPAEIEKSLLCMSTAELHESRLIIFPEAAAVYEKRWAVFRSDFRSEFCFGSVSRGLASADGIKNLWLVARDPETQVRFPPVALTLNKVVRAGDGEVYALLYRLSDPMIFNSLLSAADAALVAGGAD